VEAVRVQVLQVLEIFCCDVLSSSTEHAGAANARLLLPLATALRPSNDVAQQQLLLSLLQRHPPLQASYLAACPLPLAPATSYKFLTSAAVMAKALALIPGADTHGSLLHALHILPPHQALAFQQLLAGTQHAGGLAAIVPPPPARTVPSLTDWIAPPQLCKGTLGPGLQHASYLVRLASAQLLMLILARVQAASHALLATSAGLDAARAREVQGDTAGAAAAATSAVWRDSAARLKRAVRARLPDFQVLVAARQHAAARAAPGGGRKEASTGDAGGGAGGEGEEVGDPAAQAQLLLPRLLQVLGQYITLFPECLAVSE
jgi:hypothetical protein